MKYLLLSLIAIVFLSSCENFGKRKKEDKGPTTEELYEQAREKASKDNGDKASFLGLQVGMDFSDAEKTVKKLKKDGTLGDETRLTIGKFYFTGPKYKLVGDDFQAETIVRHREYKDKMLDLSVYAYKGIDDTEKLVKFLDGKYGDHFNFWKNNYSRYFWFKGASEIELIDFKDEQEIIFTDIVAFDERKHLLETAQEIADSVKKAETNNAFQ